MNTPFSNLTREIQADKAGFGEEMAPPAPADAIKFVCAESVQKLGYTLPEAYLQLLQITNGIDCNGIQLYASQAQMRLAEERRKFVFRGIVEANEQWREYEPNQQYVFFAESGGELYCHNLKNGNFEIVDRITKELIYEPSSFADCEGLLKVLLNHMLDRYDLEDEEV
jgi:SMI1-KNR4 cell-wall